MSLTEGAGERFRRVHELLDRALQVAPDQRSIFLDEAAGVDPEMRRELASLLRSFGPTDRFDEPGRDRGGFDRPGALDLLTTENDPRFWLESQPPFAPGMRVGVYRLERVLGSGGAGQVFLAGRDDDAFKKQVAVKVMKRGMDTDELVRRFRSERQILAHLEHPNIAKLLDGGATEDGRPFLVMEYVAEGKPIHAWCRDQGLDLRGRIDLFLAVCDAVRFAHGRLIVHRDLKPDNILVSKEGEVRLLDFGIAKLLDPKSFPGTVLPTGPGWRAMTPEYASPEQVRGEAVTTASDVYSLGVILYELLALRRPYEIEERTVSGIERVVCTVEPPSASRLVSERPDGGGRLARQLSGDLDDILRMALEKEQDLRYASVDQLEADLRRYLEGLPVTARRSSTFYRASKFIGRHRWGVGSALLSLLIVFSFAVALWAQRGDIIRQRDRAEEISTFLVDLFTLADPSHSRGEEITAREILDRGANDAEARLGNRPGLLGDVLSTIGSTYYGLGLYGEAEALLERGKRLRTEAYGEDDPTVATTMQTLAAVLHDQGRYEEAAAMTEEAIERRLEYFGDGHADVLDSRFHLAMLHQSLGRLAIADALYGEIAAAARALEESELLIRVLSRHGGLAFKLDQIDLSLARLEEAEELARSLWGEKSSHFAHLLNRQALLVQLEQPALAVELIRKSLEIHDEIYREPHPDRATFMNNLALALSYLGQFAEAESLYRRAIALEGSRSDKPTPQIALLQENLSQTISGLGRHEEAERFARLSMVSFEAILGWEHERTVMARSNLASMLSHLGRFDEAESIFRAVLDVWLKTYEEDHSRIGTALNNVGYATMMRGNTEEAALLIDRAIEILEAVSDHQPDLPIALSNRASIYSESGDLEPAIDLYLRALEALQRNGRGESLEAAELNINLIVALGRAERFEEAEELAIEGIAYYEALRGVGSERWLRVRRLLAIVVARQGREEEALPLAAENLEICHEHHGDGSQICAKHADYVVKLESSAT